MMSLQGKGLTGALRAFIAVLATAAFLLLTIGAPRVISAQETKQGTENAKSGGNAAVIARGKYIVQGVAACGQCHTPRKPNGELDYSRWLAGAPVPYLSANPQARLAYPGSAPRRPAPSQ